MSWIRACDCWLIAKGRTGDLPSEQKQQTAVGTEGTGCCGILQKKSHHQPGDRFIANSQWDVTLQGACQLKRDHRCL